MLDVVAVAVVAVGGGGGGGVAAIVVVVVVGRGRVIGVGVVGFVFFFFVASLQRVAYWPRSGYIFTEHGQRFVEGASGKRGSRNRPKIYKKITYRQFHPDMTAHIIYFPPTAHGGALSYYGPIQLLPARVAAAVHPRRLRSRLVYYRQDATGMYCLSRSSFCVRNYAFAREP